jgi:UDP-N-acetylmuramate dehydrogenase
MALTTEAPFGERWLPGAIDGIEEYARHLRINSRRDEPLRRHTSFGVGGPCPLMLFPETPDHVASLAQWAGDRGLHCRVLGGGTNLLVNDTGVNAPVMSTTHLCADSHIGEGVATFPAGLATARALHQTVAAGLDGLVWASGLPGTIGGAAAGNAGCWGGDMGSCVESLDIVDAHGQRHLLAREDLQWSYRGLAFNVEVRAPWLIIAASLRVEPGNHDLLRSRYEDLQTRKRESQPVGARNSGCIFRNPDGRAAGAILDAAGCKGMRVGGAVVSHEHANFIVNDRGASAADVGALIEQLTAAAERAAGVELVPEVRRW